MIYKVDDFPEKLEDFPQALNFSGKKIYCDTETDGLDPLSDRLITVQLWEESAGAFVFDFRALTQDVFFKLKTLLESNDVCFFNAKFDLKFLFSNGIFPKRIYDVFLGHWVATGNVESLKDLLEKAGITISKKTRKKFDARCELDRERLEYCRDDVVHLKRLDDRVFEALKKHELTACARLEYDVCPVYAKMELAGIGFDEDAWLKNAEDHLPRIDRALRDLDDYVLAHPLLRCYRGNVQNELFSDSGRRCSIDWDSPLEVAKVVSKVPEIVSVVKAEKIKTSAKELEELVYMDKSGFFLPYTKDFELCALILNYRKLKKIAVAYGRSFLKYVHPKTGRIHPEFLQFGTETGRVSSRNPNCQNIPRNEAFRSCFKADPGRKVVTADYSQIEIRIAAKITEEPLLIEAFEKGQDPYGAIGTKMFKMPVSKKENPHLRQIAKSILLGLNYGMGPERLSATLNCSLEQAKDYIRSFYSAMPNLKKGLERLGKYAVAQKESRTMPPIRRRRIFPYGENDYKEKARVERQGKNTPIQGTNADILKLALVMLDKEVCDKTTFIVNNVHDEIVLETDASSAEEVRIKTEQTMKKAAGIVLKGVRVDVESCVDDCWSK
jgi:DNA polymerase-1